MRSSTLLLVVGALAVALSVPADRLIREGTACTLINAWTSESLSSGKYVDIEASPGQSQQHTCNNETFNTPYTITGTASSCAGSAGLPTGVLYSRSGLAAGRYEVTVGSDGCIELCICP